MTSFPIYLLGLFQILFACSTAFGQTTPEAPSHNPDYHVEQFTNENGLPQTSVKSIARDKRGNIWLATERGVVRYDGHHFVNFDQFGDAYLDRNINDFYPDPRPGSERFMALNHRYASIGISRGKASLDSMSIGRLAGRSTGPNPRKLISLAKSLPDTVHSEQPYSIALIFLVQGDKHFVYDEQHVTLYRNNRIKKVILFPDRRLFYFFALGGDLYYLDDNLGVFRFQGSGPDSLVTKTELRGAISKEHLFTRTRKYTLYWNNAADQAFVALGSSLYLLQPLKDGTLQTRLILDGFDFKANVIRSIYFDLTTDRVFLGSQLNGLFVITKKRSKWCQPACRFVTMFIMARHCLTAAAYSPQRDYFLNSCLIKNMLAVSVFRP